MTTSGDKNIWQPLSEFETVWRALHVFIVSFGITYLIAWLQPSIIGDKTIALYGMQAQLCKDNMPCTSLIEKWNVMAGIAPAGYDIPVLLFTILAIQASLALVLAFDAGKERESGISDKISHLSFYLLYAICALVGLLLPSMVRGVVCDNQNCQSDQWPFLGLLFAVGIPGCSICLANISNVLRSEAVKNYKKQMQKKTKQRDERNSGLQAKLAGGDDWMKWGKLSGGKAFLLIIVSFLVPCLIFSIPQIILQVMSRTFIPEFLVYLLFPVSLHMLAIIASASLLDSLSGRKSIFYVLLYLIGNFWYIYYIYSYIFIVIDKPGYYIISGVWSLVILSLTVFSLPSFYLEDKKNKPGERKKYNYCRIPGFPLTFKNRLQYWYCAWISDSHSLVYDANAKDATGTTAEQKGATDQSVTVSDNGFKRSDYTFISWNTQTDGKGTSYRKGDKIVLPAGTTILYAQWKQIPATVHYDPNGGTGSTPDTNGGKGDRTTLTPNGYSKECWLFDSWNTKQDGTGTKCTDKQAVTLDGDLTLYAQWKHNPACTATLTYDKNSETATGTTKGYSGWKGVAATIAGNGFENEGYTFDSWNTQPDGKGTSHKKGDKIVLPAGITTLYAQWK